MQHAMKLLHLSSSLKVGGAETILCNLLEGLSAGDFDHHVIFFHDGPMRTRIEALGIKTYHIGGLFFLYDLFFWIRLWRCIKTINPDRIHSLLWAANVAGRLMGKTQGIPVVSVYHNNVDQDGVLRNIIDRLTIKLSTKIVAVSDEVADSICANMPSVTRNKVTVIKNGIDIFAITYLSERYRVNREELGLSSEFLVIGSVGRWVSVKNYPLLLRAFARVAKQISKARLLLVGQGPEEEALRAVAQQLGIYELVYFVKANPAYGYYHVFDVFVQSSDKEGISIALLEAMCLRIPCVVTNSNSIHPVIKHGQNGLVVPAGGEEQLSQALQELLCDEHLQQNLMDTAYGVLRRDFDQEHMLSCYKDAFRTNRNNFP